jgi:uncharacterized protein|tara:strand:+ start:3453 stop:5303 length:1851 start_codon:yes stop_codon:yes gene_type:complete
LFKKIVEFKQQILKNSLNSLEFMNKFTVFVVMGILILLLPAVSAQQGHMRLLAVSETNGGQEGGIADLFLEIKEGSGRVFLETFPLTKLDTQISTRFAKEIACDFADENCDKFDFFYTITADSPIIAGPSAGAAITLLTFSLIEDVNLDENTAITGTINSGGLIGPVGGLKAKIEAASKVGIKKVLIPIGESLNGENKSSGNESMNESLDLVELRKQYGMEIIEIPTFDEAIFEFTGKKFREKEENLTISQDYKDTMKMLAIQLCSRSTKLKNKVLNLTTDNRTKPALDNAINLSSKGKDSFSKSTYYSSASYCFGANVEFNHLYLFHLNLTEKGAEEKVNELRQEIDDFDEIIETERIKTITDIESYMIVKERLLEAYNFLGLVEESIQNNNTNLRNLAYSIERINSAKSWAIFLDNTGKEFDFNDEVLENACRTKLSEVEERLQYVQLYFPQNLEATRKELSYAYQDLKEGNHELCLFKASKAKANVDTVLSVFGVKTSNVGNVVDQKLAIVERNLVDATKKGVFPIVGYSYFEYANSLKETDPFSALLYSEYALELSNLDIYFKSSSSSRIKLFENIDGRLFVVLIMGIVLGVFASKIIGYKSKRRVKSKRKK